MFAYSPERRAFLESVIATLGIAACGRRSTDGTQTKTATVVPAPTALPTSQPERSPVIDPRRIEAVRYIREINAAFRTGFTPRVYDGRHETVATFADAELFRFVQQHREPIYRGAEWNLPVAGMWVNTVFTYTEVDGQMLLSQFRIRAPLAESDIEELSQPFRQLGKEPKVVRPILEQAAYTAFNLSPNRNWKFAYQAGGQGQWPIRSISSKDVQSGKGAIEVMVLHTGEAEFTFTEPFHLPFGKR